MLSTRSVTPPPNRRGWRRRPARWFLGALAAGAVLALAGFHPGARRRRIPAPRRSGRTAPRRVARGRDYRGMAGTRDPADGLPGRAGDHGSGLLPSGGAGCGRPVHDRPGAPCAGADPARRDPASGRDSHHPRAHGPSRPSLAQRAAQGRHSGQLSGMPRFDRAVGLHRCPAAVVGREHHRARAQDHRDGRAPLGPPMAVAGGPRLQQLRDRERRCADADRVRLGVYPALLAVEQRSAPACGVFGRRL